VASCKVASCKVASCMGILKEDLFRRAYRSKSKQKCTESVYPAGTRGSNVQILSFCGKHDIFKNPKFLRDNKTFLNRSSVHIGGLRHPPMCLFDTLFVRLPVLTL
jgi:hypothetical protein